jgi:competence protein ComEA
MNTLIKQTITKTIAAIVITFSMVSLAQAVNINTADSQSIAESLNGVGIKKAEAIIAWRTSNGEFKTADDLSNVKGIGQKTVEKNRTNIQL